MPTSLSGCRLGKYAGLVSFPFRQLTTPSFALDTHPYLVPSRVRTLLPIVRSYRFSRFPLSLNLCIIGYPTHTAFHRSPPKTPAISPFSKKGLTVFTCSSLLRITLLATFHVMVKMKTPAPPTARIAPCFISFHRKYLISGIFRIVSAHKRKTKTLKVNICPPTIAQVDLGSFAPLKNCSLVSTSHRHC